ncbi:MAG: glycosyltransferase [Lachnospiraceae bacterium]|nr:glycosyltransferase [Lachnospiraceae bacterium]
MKIVLIGPVYPYKGGIAHYTSLLCKALRKKHEVTMISYKMQYPKLLFKKEQKDFSNDFFKVEDTNYLIHTANPFNIIGVSHKINSIHPDAVIIQWWHPYFSPCYRILVNHLKKDIKVIYTCHNVFPHERFPMDRFLTKLVLKKGDGFIVHSLSDEKDLLSIKSDVNKCFNPIPSFNAFRIKNTPINEARREIVEKDGFDIKENTPLLLFFGFVREYKGLKHLLNSMPLIIEKMGNCKLLVVGSFGDDKQDYLDMIEKNGVSASVFLKDTYTPDDEVEKYFAAADIVVLPYEDATQSGIVQIAYGFEKPVLVTNVGGLPDVVTNDKTGYVVEPKNPEAIYKAVLDYFSNNRFEEFNEEIKKEAFRFSWEHMTESIDSLFV